MKMDRPNDKLEDNLFLIRLAMYSIRMVSSPEFCEKRYTGGQVCQKIEKKKEDPVAR